MMWISGAARREKAEVQRVVQNRKLTAQLAEEVQRLFPGASAPASRKAAAPDGRLRHSLWVKAPSRLREVIASIRHRHTNYDELLMSREEAGRRRQRSAPVRSRTF